MPDVGPLVIAAVMLGLGAAVGGSVRYMRLRRGPTPIGASAAVLLGMVGSAVAFAVVGVLIPAQSFVETEVSQHPIAWVVPVAVDVLAAWVATWIVMDVASRITERRAHRPPEQRLREYLAVGEGSAVEFKSSARFNPSTGARDPRLEVVVAKTVAGFANAEGGTLVIGVDDAGRVVGLAEDYALVKFPDADRFELWLRDWLSRALGRHLATLVRVEFVRVESDEVCLVTVPVSNRPVFLATAKDADPEFWVRTGNSTRRLAAPDLLEYVAGHRAFRRRR